MTSVEFVSRAWCVFLHSGWVYQIFGVVRFLGFPFCLEIPIFGRGEVSNFSVGFRAFLAQFFGFPCCFFGFPLVSVLGCFGFSKPVFWFFGRFWVFGFEIFGF